MSVALSAVLTTSVAGEAPTAHADACYTWTRNLRRGMVGDDVRELRLRIAGYPGFNAELEVTRGFGPATADALRRFKAAYGLRADEIAGSGVFALLYSLQDDDCTPINFSYDQMDDGCGGSGFDGGAVSVPRARRNALKIMWKLEALRHAVGDRPISVVSAFRSYACNAGVGVTRSRHLYADAADIVSDSVSLCTLAVAARHRGFSGIYGPGYPNHHDHVHVSGDYESWSAEECGIDGGRDTAHSESADLVTRVAR